MLLVSPLIRAKQTAEIIANKNGITNIIEEKLLIERDFGVMTGKSTQLIQQLCSPDVLQTDGVTYFLKPDGAETFPDLLKRAGSLLSKLKYLNSNILVVTHGDIGKMIIASFCNIHWKHALRKFYFDNSGLVELSYKDNPSMKIL